MDEYLKRLDLDLSNALTGAQNLLGYKLVHSSPSGVVSGYIVETEAYMDTDPASHSFKGNTPSKASLFKSAGTIYVYFTYGLHYCVNIVAGPSHSGQAILIRALEPVEGLVQMTERRKVVNDLQLTNGPAKLTQALAIDKSVDGTNILDGPITLEKGFIPKAIVTDVRIGISQAKENPWRFYVKDNLYVSRLAK